MNNHLTTPQKTQLQQYFSESPILQGFQPFKNRAFCPFLTKISSSQNLKVAIYKGYKVLVRSKKA